MTYGGDVMLDEDRARYDPGYPCGDRYLPVEHEYNRPRGLQGKEERRLFDLVDKLRDLDVHKELKLPQLVVCGSQSSGKSSVLEAISGLSFPRGELSCTKFATELRFRPVNVETSDIEKPCDSTFQQREMLPSPQGRSPLSIPDDTEKMKKYSIDLSEVLEASSVAYSSELSKDRIFGVFINPACMDENSVSAGGRSWNKREFQQGKRKPAVSLSSTLSCEVPEIDEALEKRKRHWVDHERDGGSNNPWFQPVRLNPDDDDNDDHFGFRRAELPPMPGGGGRERKCGWYCPCCTRNERPSASSVTINYSALAATTNCADTSSVITNKSATSGFAKDTSQDSQFPCNCKARRIRKTYGANYNAAAHLRRAHFNPCKNRRRSGVMPTPKQVTVKGGMTVSASIIAIWKRAIDRTCTQRSRVPTIKDSSWASTMESCGADHSWSVNQLVLCPN